ncbi:MAG: trypsin-like serine peptidase [Candidatus Promineifilaceae bacterium]
MQEVQVRFDYRRTKPNSEPADNRAWIAMHSDGILDYKPYSKKADSPDGIKKKKLPAGHELDFAVLRLSRDVGDEIPEGEIEPRGWIDLSADPPIPDEQTPVLIVQHPGREKPPPPQMPLQITFATPGFEELNANRTRIAYTPSTKSGSSGSPVFDGNLTAVALHHRFGRPHPGHANLVENNRGIPLATIRAALDDDVREMLIEPPHWHRGAQSG